ncbi:MAG: ABC transporter ATP-binding protein [Planctomycetia bacterium]|jgi:putative ABC transport system ATP-binding protein|nr:ABC transporter ATP-binding protein [Planctomycetia bacterium]
MAATHTFDELAVEDLAVRVRGVTKEFGSGDSLARALRGVDLDVPYGELLMLVGPSGCGKTTLVSIVAGTLQPTAGDVMVLGKDLVTMSNGHKVRFRRDNVGFVFQSYNLLPSLTAAENAAVPLLIAGWRRSRAVAAASDVLDLLGLGDRLRNLPSELSGGQQQRVAIARALVHEPRLLVCDEPTSALDAENGRITMELIQRIAVQPDRAVIVVTHDSRAYSFADRIALMEDGRIESVESGPHHAADHRD